VRAPAILADDLTGALDTAAQFTGQWGPLTVQVGAPAMPLPPPCAISSETRDLPAPAAVPLSLAAARGLAGGVSFRKIDSLLRGPWVAELAALHRAGGFARCVLAPAFPAQGRRTAGGWQCVPGGLPIDIAALLAGAGLAAEARGPVRIADAATDADLAAVVAAEAPSDPLWCGAAGLALAVAGAPPARPALPPTLTLAVVGSDHPVTLAQLAVVAARRPTAIRRLRPGQPPDPSWRPAPGAPVVLGFELPPGLARAAAAAAIAAELGRLLPLLPPPRRLVVTGGATLGAVLAAVACRRLRCRGEVAPGLAVSDLGEGPWQGVEVLSKSGAFGTDDTLFDLCTAPDRIARG
jgi:uncharacterized protein YgbK (DUF1537 family)